MESDFISARDTESKVLEVSELISMFADKVSEQQEAIDLIHEHTLRSHDNVSSGTKQLEVAISRQSDRRLFTLVFFLTLTLTLIFLDFVYD